MDLIGMRLKIKVKVKVIIIKIMKARKMIKKVIIN
jgi:hypothetical protein